LTQAIRQYFVRTAEQRTIKAISFAQVAAKKLHKEKERVIC
jgi:hypothetical protein